MGEVWAAQHTSLDIPCAVKFIHAESAAKPEVREAIEKASRAKIRASRRFTIRTWISPRSGWRWSRETTPSSSSSRSACASASAALRRCSRAAGRCPVQHAVAVWARRPKPARTW